MDYFCDVCDKTVKPKSKNKHLKSLTHIHYEKFFRINVTIENPNFSDVDKIFNDFITNHNKALNYIFRAGFKIDFDSFTPHIKTIFLI